MEATPLISVITCTYNAEATLERTLLSVTGHTVSRYASSGNRMRDSTTR